jgi:hypothetical protein
VDLNLLNCINHDMLDCNSLFVFAELLSLKTVVLKIVGTQFFGGFFFFVLVVTLVNSID